MSQVVLQCGTHSGVENCGMCGQAVQLTAGPQLRMVDAFNAVCSVCADKHAPSLAALLNLGRTAERIGRMGRHSVFPPLSALLDLASAAEQYTSTVTPQRKAG